MISKFSVKKPLTIFVAVIAVIILGVVAFTNMTPDLLPNINLPYAIVMTTYPGASPEEVETAITKPMEQSLATMDKIDTITSQSAENYSLVILQFADDANMDTISSDIREKIDLISGYWNDSVGTPTILKLNPNMMPVMVAAVEQDGKSVTELTNFLNETLLGELEGISGVASISTMGMIEEGVHVILNQDKIDAANQKLQNAISGNFSDAEQEIADGKAELADGESQVADGKAQIESGKTQITAGQSEAASQFAQAENQIQEQKTELVAAKQLLDAQIAILDATLPQLEETLQQLQTISSSLSALDASEKDVKKQLDEAKADKAACEAVKQQYADQIAAIEADTALSEEEKQSQIQAIQNSAPYLENETKLAAATASIPVLEANLAQIQAQITAINSQLATLGISQSELDDMIAELQTQIAAAKEGRQQLQQTKTQLESGLISINDAIVQLETQKANTNLQMSGGLAQLIAGESALNSTEAQLESAKKQLDDAEEQLSAAKDTALESADLSNTITMDMISGILTAQNFSMPAGYATDSDDQQVLVRVGDKLGGLEELEGLLLFDPGIDGADPIYLADVADIIKVDTSDSTYARINGNDGIVLSFSKQSNYATADVSENLRAEFDLLADKYDGLGFVPLMDQGDYIYLIVDSVLQNLLYGAILAIFILLLFLKDWRPTLIIACSIPVSLVFAIVLMYFSGVTLNVISLSGLAVGVGMLVDNSVVVIENIYRLRSKGVSVLKAAVTGASQVAAAITASTLTTICVFLPIVFIDGITRELFTDMALTIGYSLVASLIVALTLVPAMSRGMLKRETTVTHKLFDRLVSVYEKSIRFVLRHRLPVLLVAIVVMVASVPLSLSRGFSFMPAMESEQVEVTLQMPEEYELSQTVETANAIIDRIEEMDGVETVGAMLSSSGNMMGMGGSSDADVTNVSMYVLLDKGFKSSSISKQIVNECADFDCEITATGAMDMTSLMSGMSGSGVAVNLYGDDLDQLQKNAKELGEVMRTVDGIGTVNDGMEENTPELRITVDKNKAMAKGLTVAQVYQEIAGALKDETTSISLKLGTVNADVVVIDEAAKEMTPDKVRSYEFTIEKQDGEKETFRLSDIAEVTETESLNTIARDSQRRYLSISGTLKDGYNISLVTTAVQRAFNEVDLPEGMSIEYSGENETIMEAMGQLLLMLLLAVILIYLIMVAQFQSLRSPFIVMFTIPLAFTGGLLALFIAGMEVSVISMIGFVMLSGIIVNNGIVLVDYVNQLRADGLDKKEALVQAGKTRMRPIMMTALTTILAMSVMAIGAGMGAELMQPIAVVCIGGLVYATIMTLYVVPVMYDLLNRKKYKVVRDEDVEFIEQ